jgi:hypothetical protein
MGIIPFQGLKFFLQKRCPAVSDHTAFAAAHFIIACEIFRHDFL